jgi:DNA-binding NarL/FixJ family response regulator
VDVDIEPAVADAFLTGREALRSGEWEKARECFAATVELGERADAIEALGMAAWWLDDARLTIESRERAYRLHREHGDVAGAARMAIWLAWDYIAFRGEPAVANGWLQRARRLLDDLEPTAEHGWLAIREAEFAFMLGNDMAEAHRLAKAAGEIGRALGEADLELSALALEGLTLASEGQVAEGIRMLDEVSAAAVSGEISELWAAGRACCYLITACERVHDFDRATQWSERMLEFAKRWRIPHLFGVCRAHYASVLVWRGTWSKAEAEFEAAMQSFATTRPGLGFEAVVRLAELRRRQGRLDEATMLFREVEFHPHAKLGLAAVALDEGNAALASDVAERFLRQLGDEDRLQRVAGLDLLVRARVAESRLLEARSALIEMQALVALVGTEPLRSRELATAGALIHAEGDAETAALRFEDAIDGFHRMGAPFEKARVRLDLAQALASLGRTPAAVEQARIAHESLRAIGATREATRAAAVLRALESPDPDGSLRALTPREIEVLRHISQGLSNPEIAARLVVSEHTVHRHVANILGKLALPSRAAAAVWGVRHGVL